MPGDALMRDAAPRLPGWYGKMPALGDFASRRLPPAFIGVWDAWLQRGMAASRASLQERWLETYLNGPLWSFAVLPGVCGASAWAGTLMPSVDKVGRHFPLTIAVELEPQPEVVSAILSAQRWYSDLEQIALDCLNAGFDPDRLEERLAANTFPRAQAAQEQEAARRLEHWWNSATVGAMALELPASETLRELFQVAGLNGYGRKGCGKSLWWTEAAAGGPIHLLAYTGLPGGDDFATLLAAGR
ncbi:type VI secretion system protein ImpM [Duganella sp. CF458]|uniref:type VI secretion system-associated protein TagF n=1 Tax=Duganella sp. CF458 TaxID=1884368 RepID=UPI0008E8672B|nr:type VI secretion system-associated protein TagF [Duganella sp. CF458]SFG09826.1 type VI secretion system protein ImpM [Duganella sp. CF458]